MHSVDARPVAADVCAMLRVSVCLRDIDVISKTGFNRNCVSILYRFRDTASYLSKFADFTLPHLHFTPPLGRPRSIFEKMFGIRKLESLGFPAALFA